MQVLASGQAGLFAVQTGSGYAVERIDTGQSFHIGARELAYYFANCNDVDAFSARNREEAKRRTEQAWAADRAVRLFVILLDPQELPADLVEVGEALDELLAVPGTEEMLERQIFSAPLPKPIIVQPIVEALQAADRSRALFERFLSLQAPIARVRAAFDQIGDASFADRRSRHHFREQAIDRGSFRTLVHAASSAGKIDGALFDLYSELKGLDDYRAVIQQWTTSFERQHHHRYVIAAEPEERAVHDEAHGGAGGRQAFERAMRQQAAIVERIRAADFDAARRYARDMIAEQGRTGSSEHIAKSLSSISQQAKQLDVVELALEWAQEAVEAKPDDPLAHALLADQLMRIGRYAEARQNLDLAESFGEGAFAASGRARILRYQGQFADALAAYRRAYAQDRTSARGHFNLAGIAECLRDMEEFDEALAAYDTAIAEYPHEAALHAGRAATLVDLSRYEEALTGYRDALQFDDNNVVSRNGIASLYRRAGDFARAEDAYRAVICDYPFDAHSRGGLVGTLRELGRFADAVEEASILAKLLPASADAAWILADALVDSGDFEGAIATFNASVENNPHVAGLRAGLARVEKARGNYAAALALYDEAAREFPSGAWIQVGRADMLRRLGAVDEALRIYERELERHPHRLSVKNALASIYIHQSEFDLALTLLTIDDPRNADEWRNFVLHGMLDSATGHIGVARERFAWGIERCPFRRESRMLRAALSRAELQQGRFAEAITTARECVDDVTELVKFHASATMQDKQPAQALYDRLRHGNLPEPYHELRDEIAANYNVIALRPRRTMDWVLARETDVLLLEAA